MCEEGDKKRQQKKGGAELSNYDPRLLDRQIKNLYDEDKKDRL